MLINCVIASLFCLGWWTLYQPENLLGFVGNWLNKYEESYWAKPLGACFVCMASVYGALCFWILGVPIIDYWYLVLVVGINRIVNRVSSISSTLSELKDWAAYYINSTLNNK